MTKDEQARARLVEIALEVEVAQRHAAFGLGDATEVRTRAGFKNPRSGSWCAAGLTAAMEDAGLVVPAPGTPARRGAVALLDWVGNRTDLFFVAEHNAVVLPPWLAPGDIIAWKQNKAPEEWIVEMHGDGLKHAYATATSSRSMCGKATRANGAHGRSYMVPPTRCSSCVWETRKGHVAGIVAVDDESITTVGWNEGNAPGRVMKRRLWRDPMKKCTTCKGMGLVSANTGLRRAVCRTCKGNMVVPRSSTVLHRKPNGLLYGIARPVAR